MTVDSTTFLVACPYCGAARAVACPTVPHVERLLAASRQIGA